MLIRSVLFAVSAATMSLVGWAAHAQEAQAEASTDLAAPTGDADAGETQFRQCRACHMIEDSAGEIIQRGGRTGPNLYGVVGVQAATADEDFGYSDVLIEIGEEGLIWDEENFVAYVENPTHFVREASGNTSARSPMAFQMRSGADDMYAYLAQFTDDDTDENGAQGEAD